VFFAAAAAAGGLVSRRAKAERDKHCPFQIRIYSTCLLHTPPHAQLWTF
jgi:hypothetical protein